MLLFGSILLETGCSREKTAAFKTRDAADKACYEYLRKEIEKEVNGTSDSRKENWTQIKNDDEQYLIFDYGCKPKFSEGDTIGELIPLYFYLDKRGDLEYTRVWN